MSMLFTYLLVCFALGGQIENDRAREALESDEYTIEWGKPRRFDICSALEIGAGVGHSPFGLGWTRFRPEQGRVAVLSVELLGDKPYRSKWPSDAGQVTVKRGWMSLQTYAALLGYMAIVDSAHLRPIESGFGITSADGWMHARLSDNKAALIDFDWAGYFHPGTQIEWAKPGAAVALATTAMASVDFQPHTLTDDERNWASAKFVRDWNRYKGSESHWWVRYRCIQTIGIVGNSSALLVLRDILEENSDNYAVYYAINAITRLTKIDVREQPAEEMDLEKARLKVLDMLKEYKEAGGSSVAATEPCSPCQVFAQWTPARLPQSAATARRRILPLRLGVRRW
jgi:hypothetical protein